MTALQLLIIFSMAVVMFGLGYWLGKSAGMAHAINYFNMKQMQVLQSLGSKAKVHIIKGGKTDGEDK